MSDLVRRVDFTANLLPEVSGFDCGSEPSAREVAEWIGGKNPGNSVLVDVGSGTKVWLYVNQTGDIVGFGSLGTTAWRWPGPRDPKIPFSVIPASGVRADLRGLPRGTGELPYSVQILRDLIAEASGRNHDLPLLGLFVHEENERAARFYERFGFFKLDNRRGYDRMVLKL